MFSIVLWVWYWTYGTDCPMCRHDKIKINIYTYTYNYFTCSDYAAFFFLWLVFNDHYYNNDTICPAIANYAFWCSCTLVYARAQQSNVFQWRFTLVRLPSFAIISFKASVFKNTTVYLMILRYSMENTYAALLARCAFKTPWKHHIHWGLQKKRTQTIDFQMLQRN
jgi:hypothetical protein